MGFGPLPAVPNVANVSVSGLFGATIPWDCSFHIAFSAGPPNNLDLIAAATAIHGEWVTAFGPYQPSETTLEQVKLTDLTTPSSAIGLYAASVAGSEVGTDVPASTACVVSHSILRRYKGGHPRTYLPVGTSSDLQTQSTWKAAFTTAIDGAFTSFLAALLAAHVTYVPQYYANVSYYSAGTRRVTPVLDPIQSSAARTAVGTQRRRLR